MRDPLLFLCAVVESNDRDDTVVHTEQGHEEEALELEVYAEHCSCCGRKTEQDLVHSKRHDGTDRCHQDRRNADNIDIFHSRTVKAHSFKGKFQFLVFVKVKENTERHGNNLTEYSGCGSACNAHFRETEVAEDQDRVKNDIDDRSDSLCDHSIEGASR